MGDFIYDNLGWIVVVLIVLLFALIIVGAREEGIARDKFMSACLADKKEYECTAMWRAGNRSTTVVPVPIVVR